MRFSDNAVFNVYIYQSYVSLAGNDCTIGFYCSQTWHLVFKWLDVRKGWVSSQKLSKSKWLEECSAVFYNYVHANYYFYSLMQGYSIMLPQTQDLII